MALLDVVVYGHPTLRRVARPLKVEEIDQKFIEDMIETMRVKDGIGLAAPQVDVPVRLIVVAMDAENAQVVINPEIFAHSERDVIGPEGCLSLPGLQGEVARNDRVLVRGLDRHGQSIEIKVSGLMARVFQHEIDHLNGDLYIDRAESDSMVWLEKEGEQKTSVAEIRDRYLEIYHRHSTQVEFDKPEA